MVSACLHAHIISPCLPSPVQAVGPPSLADRIYGCNPRASKPLLLCIPRCPQHVH
ncbi:hypothetical protein CHLRE_06g257167v5 [Chlamydomonas reinhardtii]|uniref:Uncharacterized protein n=1 Tax=Chlamydomonas reinhardtii TaxID=3055 RepID=A0A2K3DMF8_CHLRE|nr:uncharacterized protein CHLRE_06g257167v5 [Chlamydomonas reinhardtii]PNW81712.1 hypothetical protein CHLRE_06g257167v5 [Chlamydomonas reinhardtii]